MEEKNSSKLFVRAANEMPMGMKLSLQKCEHMVEISQ